MILIFIIIIVIIIIIIIIIIIDRLQKCRLWNIWINLCKQLNILYMYPLNYIIIYYNFIYNLECTKYVL